MEKVDLRELLPLFATVFGVLTVALAYGALPDTIPIHLGLLGETHFSGPKYIIWIVSAVAISMYIAQLVAQRTQLYKLPWKVTDSNRAASTELAGNFLYTIRVFMSLILAYLQWAMVQVSLGRMSSIGVWFGPGFLLGTFVIVGFYVLKGLRLSQPE